MGFRITAKLSELEQDALFSKSEAFTFAHACIIMKYNRLIGVTGCRNPADICNEYVFVSSEERRVVEKSISGL